MLLPALLRGVQCGKVFRVGIEREIGEICIEYLFSIDEEEKEEVLVVTDCQIDDWFSD